MVAWSPNYIAASNFNACYQPKQEIYGRATRKVSQRKRRNYAKRGIKPYRCKIGFSYNSEMTVTKVAGKSLPTTEE